MRCMRAGPTHFGGGVVGILSNAVFADPVLLHKYLNHPPPDVGLLFGGSGALLAAQLVAVAAVSAWAASTSGLLMFVLRCAGLLRQSVEVEVLGMDAELFEGKQRDEKLAFLVIQHAVRTDWQCREERHACMHLRSMTQQRMAAAAPHACSGV
jgi:ammonia channel protein AmtB